MTKLTSLPDQPHLEHLEKLALLAVQLYFVFTTDINTVMKGCGRDD